MEAVHPLNNSMKRFSLVDISSLFLCGSREKKKKECYTSSNFLFPMKLHLFHTFGWNLPYILASMDSKRALSQIVEIVPQNCTIEVIITLFIRKIHMYTFEDTQL